MVRKFANIQILIRRYSSLKIVLKIKYIFDNLFKIDLANSISNMIIEAYANISHVFIVPGAFHRLRKRIVPLTQCPRATVGGRGSV